VIALDDEVDRFSLYVIRQLKAAVQSEAVMKNIGLSNQRDCLGYRVIVKSVERIADHACKIAESVLELDEKVDNSVLQKISEIDSFARSVFDDATRSLYTKDYALADSVVSKAKTIAAMENKAVIAFAKKGAKGISTVRMIMESVRRTAEYASDIAEIVLNLNVDQIIAD
jgi:Na+/phosphate symporter